jgi:hypothetical protein
MPLRSPPNVRLDLACLSTPRHLTAGTQTGEQTADGCSAKYAHECSSAATAIMDLVATCVAEYETVAEQQRHTLSGLQETLSRVQQRGGAECPASLTARALDDATAETCSRAAGRDFCVRDEAIRKYLGWMQHACTVACSESLLAQRDRLSFGPVGCQPTHQQLSPARVLARPGYRLAVELQHEYFARQLRLVRSDCDRMCEEAQSQLSRALADAALARAREKTATGRCAQIALEFKGQIDQLQATNDKLRRDNQRTRLQLHTARRNLLEQYWELKHAEPLARELEGATAAATAAGLMGTVTSQSQAQPAAAATAAAAAEWDHPRAHAHAHAHAHTTATTSSIPQLGGVSASALPLPVALKERQRRCSAPNVHELARVAGGTAATRSKSWAPVAGPRSEAVIAVVHALSGMQVCTV